MIGNIVSSRPRFLLRGISSTAAYEAAKSAESNLNPKDYQQNPYFSDASVSAAIENGAWLNYWSNPGGACAGTAPNVNLFQTASGLALGTTSAGVGILGAAHVGIFASTSAVPIAGAIIAGVAAIISVIDVIFAHHAAAVRQEDQIFCAVLPAVANTFSLIQQGVQNGTITPQAASAGLDALYSKFQQAIAPSYGHSPFCNALCEQKIMLDAIVRYWKGVYADMAAAPVTAPVIPVVPPPAAAPTALPAIPPTTPNAPRPAPTVSVPTPANSSSWLTKNSLLPFAPNWALLALGGWLLLEEI